MKRVKKVRPENHDSSVRYSSRVKRLQVKKANGHPKDNFRSVNCSENIIQN